MAYYFFSGKMTKKKQLTSVNLSSPVAKNLSKYLWPQKKPIHHNITLTHHPTILHPSFNLHHNSSKNRKEPLSESLKYCGSILKELLSKKHAVCLCVCEVIVMSTIIFVSFVSYKDVYFLCLVASFLYCLLCGSALWNQQIPETQQIIDRHTTTTHRITHGLS